MSLTVNLPTAFNSALATLGVSNLDKVFDATPPTVAMFSAFLGYNPVGTIIASVPGLTVPQHVLNTMEGLKWFPETLAPAFMSSLRAAFYVGLVLSLFAAVISVLRGKRYVDAEAEYVADLDSSAEQENLGKAQVSAQPREENSGRDVTKGKDGPSIDYDTSGGVK